MIKLKITAPMSDTFDLLLPPAVTFDQLHAALELLLCSEQHASYSFMLMTERYAIEPQGADAHRIAGAFERNPVIRYRNPYPGEIYYVLELLEREVPGDSCCPAVQGIAEEAVQNERLQKYCTFTEGWVYKNKEYFQEGKKQKDHGRKNRSQMPETGSPDFFRFKKMGEKQRFLKFFGRNERNGPLSDREFRFFTCGTSGDGMDESGSSDVLLRYGNFGEGKLAETKACRMYL